MKQMPRLPLIVNKADWISRTRTARDLLVHAHGYHADEFEPLDDSTREDVTLDWCSIYPRAWGRFVPGFSGAFLHEGVCPAGLVLHWPRGVDYHGDGYDAADPILLLAECEFWASLTDEDLREMLADDVNADGAVGTGSPKRLASSPERGVS